ncbi:MAG TPA: glycosyltransferase family 4 protein [Syntrophales bacterium]|nr:glycosyltransferase family 4 protein [Syntrophales bacterium]HOL59244.1 glycosyltransferase family 4 protein [Syntrophales bacterium]HPO35294.1 glycosyltransferase family 4 protein [Syntrophales bacterium]
MRNSSAHRQVKVVHVITRFDKGGSAENTFLTVTGLDHEKYAVTLIYGVAIDENTSPLEASSIAENFSCLQEREINVIHVPHLVRPVSPLKDTCALIALYRYLRKEKPLIVHTHTSKAGILGRWAAFLAQVPIICHTPHGHVFWGYFGSLLSRLFIFLEKITAPITDRLIMLTAQERDDHLLFRVAPKEKFVVIHSGVDLQPFFQHDPSRKEKMRSSLSLGADDFVIGSVGRLTQVKGHRYLLNAYARYLGRGGKGTCVMVGEGELRKELTEQAQQLGIEKLVRFLGWRPDVAPVMKAFDVFVLPSLNEGMGKVVVEAMACGLPVIASNVGGIKDLIVHGENGLLVPPTDEESLAEAIMLLYRKPHLRKEMGEKGKQKALLYSREAMVEKIEDLYQTLIREKTKGHGANL